MNELIEGLEERAKKYSLQFKVPEQPIKTEKVRSSAERDFKQGYTQGYLKALQKTKDEQLTEIPKEEIEERRNKAYTLELKPNKSVEDKMQEMLEYILNDKETALGYLQTFMDIAEEYKNS